MLSTLFTQVEWNRVRCLGFDMDGTLYDEFEFVRQVYPACLTACAHLFQPTALKRAADFMLGRWLEKGSSYPFLFGEVFDLYGLDPGKKDFFIERAIDAHRHFVPDLDSALSSRTKWILEQSKARWPIFLVTDGRPLLQRAKFQSLGLGLYFEDRFCSFTGELPPGGAKPATAAYTVLNLPFEGAEVLYFGDRQADHDFAANSGFQFARVANMFNLEKKPFIEAP